MLLNLGNVFESKFYFSDPSKSFGSNQHFLNQSRCLIEEFEKKVEWFIQFDRFLWPVDSTFESETISIKDASLITHYDCHTFYIALQNLIKRMDYIKSLSFGLLLNKQIQCDICRILFSHRKKQQSSNWNAAAKYSQENKKQ